MWKNLMGRIIPLKNLCILKQPCIVKNIQMIQKHIVRVRLLDNVLVAKELETANIVKEQDESMIMDQWLLLQRKNMTKDAVCVKVQEIVESAMEKEG